MILDNIGQYGGFHHDSLVRSHLAAQARPTRGSTSNQRITPRLWLPLIAMFSVGNRFLSTPQEQIAQVTGNFNADVLSQEYVTVKKGEYVTHIHASDIPRAWALVRRNDSHRTQGMIPKALLEPRWLTIVFLVSFRWCGNNRQKTMSSSAPLHTSI